MHSFHQSRGRIVFDAFCALAIAASFAVAWMQTGASAILPAAGVSALYALVRLFDMRRPRSTVAIEPRPVELAEEPALAFPILEQPAEPVPVVDVTQAAEQAPKVKAARRAKSPRKTGGQRVKSPEATNVTDFASAPEPQVEVFDIGEPAETPTPAGDDEAYHAPVTPLFEPEPFVVQQRAVFGRKTG